MSGAFGLAKVISAATTQVGPTRKRTNYVKLVPSFGPRRMRERLLPWWSLEPITRGLGNGILDSCLCHGNVARFL
jgi:hypothetical protein